MNLDAVYPIHERGGRETTILLFRNYALFYFVCGRDGKLVYQIKSGRFWKGEKDIVDLDHKKIYTTGRKIIHDAGHGETLRYLIYRSSSKDVVATASLIYEEEADEKQIFYRLPQVVELALHSIYGEIHIKQAKNGLLLITVQKEAIGKIMSRHAFQDIVLSCDGIEDRGFLSALFVLSRYMIHENDLIVV